MLTGGDKNKIDALYTIGGSTKDGGKSLWTEELEVALKQERTIDFVVHSLKDVPTILPEGCEIGCIPERESALDSLVVKKGLPYKSLGELPDGSVVGTSSIRRVTQLKRAFPTLIFTDVVRLCLHYTILASVVANALAVFVDTFASEEICEFFDFLWLLIRVGLACPVSSS